MSSSRPVFRSRWLPYLLVAPQLIITVIFFIWPAGEALWYSLQSVDPFGFSSQFVGLDNFVTLFHDSYYLDSFWTTIKFSTFVTVSGLLVSLFFAALVEYIVRGSRFYQTLMLLPYAVAPAVAAVLWIFLFNPALQGCASLFSLPRQPGPSPPLSLPAENEAACCFSCWPGNVFAMVTQC